MVQLNYYLFISVFLFFIGVYGFVIRKNVIAMLISLELILNAAGINFAAFNQYLFQERLEGMFFTLFVIVISAAETTVALAIVISTYRTIGNININYLSRMKE